MYMDKAIYEDINYNTLSISGGMSIRPMWLIIIETLEIIVELC